MNEESRGGEIRGHDVYFPAVWEIYFVSPKFSTPGFRRSGDRRLGRDLYPPLFAKVPELGDTKEWRGNKDNSFFCNMIHHAFYLF
jgi:hypothetical protein